MYYREPKLPPLRKIHGGKFYQCRDIISLMEIPPSGPFTFVDCTMGGGSVFLNVDTHRHLEERPGCKFVAADLDRELAGVHRLVKEDGGAIHKEILKSKYNYTEKNWTAASSRRSVYPDTAAADYLLRYRGSRGGMGNDFAWSERLRGGQPGDQNAWDNFRHLHFPRIMRAYEHFHILNKCIMSIIPKYDSPSTIFYIDLPYPRESRTSGNIYRHEMPTFRSDLEKKSAIGQRVTHEDVLDLVLRSSGQFYISSYHNELYDEKLAGFEAVETDIANHSGQSKSKDRRIEVLWISPK